MVASPHVRLPRGQTAATNRRPPGGLDPAYTYTGDPTRKEGAQLP